MKCIPIFRIRCTRNKCTYRKDSIRSKGAYLSEMISRMGAHLRGLNRGEGLFKSIHPEVYHMATKSERISNIL